MAAGGAAVLAIGFGVSSIAQADDATPTPSPTSATQTTTQPTTQPTAPGTGTGGAQDTARRGAHHGLGRGFMLGLRMGADLDELAQKLGINETKLRAAIRGVHEDLKAGRASGSPTPRPADRQARLDDLATRLAGRLGISADKVKSAMEDIRAAHEADREKAFSDRLDRAVTDGKLTRAEADAVKKAAKAGIIGMGAPGGPGRGTR